MKKILALMLVLALGLASVASATPTSGVIGYKVVPTPGANTKGLEPGTPLEDSEIFYVDIVMYRAIANAGTGGSYLGIASTGSLYLSLDASEFVYTPGRYSDLNATDTNPKLDDVGVSYFLGVATQGFQYIPAVTPPPYPGTPEYAGYNVMDVHDAQNIEIAGTLPSGANDMLIMASGVGEVVMFDHIAIHCTDDGNVEVTVTPEQVSSAWGVPVIYCPETGWANDADFGAIGGSLLIYQVPEPMTMALLGLGGLALIRRRRA